MSEPRFSRRTFVGATAAAGVALAFPQIRCGGDDDGGSTGSSGAGKSVLVIGAGLAGLTAADELAREGFEVTVLEARDRVGGRVWTLREPFADGQIAEAGGEYVDVVHTEMLDLVDRFGLELDDLNEVGSDSPAVAFVDGERYSEASDIAAGEVEEARGAFYEEAGSLAEGLDPADPGDQGEELDSASAQELIDEVDPGEVARFLLEHEIRDAYGVDPDRLSLLFLVLTGIAYEEAPDDGIEAIRVRGGNDQIPKALAEELGSAISLSSPVTAISQDSGGVRVQARGGQLAADFAVLSVPLSTLKGIDLSGAVSPGDRAAAEAIQYGAATKSILQYRGAPWEQQGFSGESFTDLASGDTWVATDAQPGGRSILIAFAAGHLGDATARLGEADRIQQAARDVNAVFPGSAPRFSTGASVAWAAEPYTRGCYVAPAPGQAMGLAEESWEPEGRLYFAGDHTDRQFPGYMEGAVRSGKRAARQIIER